MEDRIAKWESANHIASIGSYYVHEALVHFYLGEHEEAHISLETVERYMHGLTDNVLKREWFVVKAINSIRLFQKGKVFHSKDEILHFLAPFMQKIETWVKLGPLLEPYWVFLKAEHSLLLEDGTHPMVVFQDALLVAHKQGYRFLEAYLYERIGMMIVDFKYQGNSQMHLREACRLYNELGMGRMMENLVDRYPELADEVKKIEPVAKRAEDDHGSQIPITHALPALDFEYFLKYSHMIAEEIQTELLLKKIMNIVIELSGAQYGCLVMESEGELWINAESQIKNKDSVEIVPLKLTESGHLCRSIIRYVHRTRESVLLHNATEAGAFKDNEEVQNLRMKSVFCLPFSKQNQIIGVLYLENRLNSDVFTATQVEMIKLLSTQAAISIENAKLVEEMKRAEKIIVASLHEKEVLLKEIHHRVKNNLQVISSLFNLQSRGIRDAEALKALRESQNRVKSMAFVHERLHHSKDLSHIGVRDYFDLLVNNIAKSFGSDGIVCRTMVDVQGTDVQLSVDLATPLGLIVNEIISNSYKHAFKAMEPDITKEIRIQLRLDHQDLLLEISDNGSGFPSDIDFKNTESLGLQLVMSLIQQVHGEIYLKKGAGHKVGGTVFQLRIPLPEGPSVSKPERGVV